jgi:hypothetical protein
VGVDIISIMVQVSDERDRKIFSLLANGRKQRVEIIKIMMEVEGVSESSIQNSLENCVKYYDEIKKIEERGDTYYQRTDLDKAPDEIIRPKQFANRSEIEEKISALENRLGIEEIKDNTGPTNPDQPPTLILNNFLEMSMNYKFILYSEEVSDRFFTIFDSYLQRISDGIAQIKNNSDEFQIQTDAMLEYRLFFQLCRNLLTNSKKGQEYEKLGMNYSKRLDEIENFFPELPPDLCLEVQRFVRELNIEKGKEFYKSMVLRDDFDDITLQREAFYTYDIHHDADDLIADLSKLSDNLSKEQADEVRNLIDSITQLYTNSSPPSEK